MKSIIITKMSLVNFKGIRSLDIDFEKTTTIAGCNGSGKTTIFDAFTWLLFGKDSNDRKTFNVKTLDEQGQAIERLPHEVSATLCIDGQETTLTRRFTEKWVKPKGCVTEEFRGNEEERLYNNVPCSVKDWNAKIVNICPEQVFKFITNPLYFAGQKADVQRQMLIRMAGGISDEEVASGNDEFKTLLGNLTGKTLEEYRKEITAKKYLIKKEIEGIPGRIDERKRTMPEQEDWRELEASLKQVQDRIAKVEESFFDESKALQEFNEKKRKAAAIVSDLQKEIAAETSKIEQRVMAEYYETEKRRSEINHIIIQEKRVSAALENDLERLKATLERANAQREDLRNEYRQRSSKTLTFSEGDFICPTCKRPLEVEDIEAKREEMLNTFNADKAKALSHISAKGKQIASEIANLESSKEDTAAKIKATQEAVMKLEEEWKSIPASEKPDSSPVIKNSTEIASLRKLIAAQEAIINEEYNDEQRDKLILVIKELKQKEADLLSKLSLREIINNSEKRIKELEEQMSMQGAELARLEGIEFTISEFGKAKIESVESKINAMFPSVRFKMFERLINGGEVETCEATFNGVPYSDLNSAAKINAGLEIINAICKSEGINAPIFIDNAESVNTLHQTDSQTIRLVVTNDKKLTITY